jgi:hypothetical protein
VDGEVKDATWWAAMGGPGFFRKSLSSLTTDPLEIRLMTGYDSYYENVAIISIELAACVCVLDMDPSECWAKCEGTWDVLASADAAQQRIFWTLSVLITFSGLLLSASLLYQYLYNPATRSPLIRSFLGMIIPNFVFFVIYFPIYVNNSWYCLPLSEGACKAVAFMHYGTVVATFCGPITVAYVLFAKFRSLRRNKLNDRFISSSVLRLLVAAPWLLGLILATGVESQGLLGSDRGLYCYASEWNHALTGGVTIVLFLVACMCTAMITV